MTIDGLDPTRRRDLAGVVAFQERLENWTALAIGTVHHAEERQRAVTLSLLHASRQTSQGLDVLLRLEDAHRRQLRTIDSVRAAALEAAERCERRAAELQRVALAAQRLSTSPVSTHGPYAPQTKRRVQAVEHRAAELADELRRSGARSRSLVDSLRVLTARLQRSGRELTETRATFTDLRVRAEAALEVLRVAERELDTISIVRDDAELRTVDLLLAGAAHLESGSDRHPGAGDADHQLATRSDDG